MAVIEANQSNFQTLIDSNEPTLVDFWAEWCGPCQMMNPIINELATDYEGKAKITKVNVDNASEISIKYGIRNIPTILLFKNGEVIDKVVGTTTKNELSKLIDKAL